MLLLTSPSLAEMNLACWVAIFGSWWSRSPWFLSVLLDSYGVFWKLLESLSFLICQCYTTLSYPSLAFLCIFWYDVVRPITASPSCGNMVPKVCTNSESIDWGGILVRGRMCHQLGSTLCTKLQMSSSFLCRMALIYPDQSSVADCCLEEVILERFPCSITSAVCTVVRTDLVCSINPIHEVVIHVDKGRDVKGFECLISELCFDPFVSSIWSLSNSRDSCTSIINCRYT